ncbi:MAG: hypothetical protein LBU88_01730 [Treponema sp.]|jgi:hypothetical protein|nr:hypothetical protein [Treponema sp.]
MKTKIYTVYDRVAEECAPLFCARTDGSAIRIFLASMDRDKSITPTDFWLYCLGGFDTEQISIMGLEKARRVMISELEQVEVTNE